MLFIERAKLDKVKIALMAMEFHDSTGIKIDLKVTADMAETCALQALSAMATNSTGHYEIVWQPQAVHLNGFSPLFIPPQLAGDAIY